MKTIKIGIFGLGRGWNFYKNILANNGDIVAICDFRPNMIERAKKDLGSNVASYTDFDEFIEHKGLDAVLIANYFHEHAPYAIKALEKNINVLSECTSNGTMAEGVELVRAAEKSKAIYMLAENYPFMKFNQEMKRVYSEGTLGKVLFAEGEYNHPFDSKDSHLMRDLRSNSKHWRYHIPRSYYITHSLAPLMYITGATPVRVSAMPVFAPEPESNGPLRNRVPEKASIITCLNDDDSVFRVTACSAFGAHENSYRICAEKGQIENQRGTDKIMLRYNEWDKPEGVNEATLYTPEWNDKDRELIESSGHGGGAFFVIREFFKYIRENKRPLFDVYFATTMASVAILGHRSQLEFGVPYDIPDFRKEEDRIKYENDTLSPFYGTDGSTPTIPSTSREEYRITPEIMAEYDKAISEL